VVVAVVVIP